MEQHYSNLVQKYLANSLTASEQEQLAAMSRLPENRAVWEAMMNAVPPGQPGDRVLEAEEQADQENDLACESQREHKETPVPERQLQHDAPPAFQWRIEVEIDPALKRIMEQEKSALFEEKIEHEDDPVSGRQSRKEDPPALKWQIEQPALKRLIEAEEDLLIERQSEHDADLAAERQTAQDGTPGRNGQKTDEGSPVHKDTETRNGHPAHEAFPSPNGHNNTPSRNGHPTHEASPSPNGHNDTTARNGHPTHETSPSPNGHNDTTTRNGHPAHETSPSRNGHTELPPLKKIITQAPPKRQRLDLERRIAAWKEKATRQPPKRQRLDLESRIATWEEKTTPVQRPPFNKQKLQLSIAATIIAITVLSVIGYCLLLQHQAQQQKMEMQNRQLITPGSDKATLILSDGTAMALDNTKDGILTVQNGVEVTKSYNELTYKLPVSGSKAVSNTIATPRGGGYQLILPDGSRVTLNAASSLTFPTIFNGVVREVTLYGEAFFEIAEDSARPFRVKAGETVVEVIGTSFNLMSYANEPVQNTTMLSGSVKLNALRLAYILRPGEQAILSYRSNRVQIKGADVEEALAWKNGKFRFVKRDIYTIMRQVERWYDVDVELKGDFSDVVLSAAITRKETVSQLLETLEATGDVRFETEGKRITVLSEK